MPNLGPRRHTSRLTKTALIASIYIVLSLFVLPLASGVIQFRLGEMLTVLPAFTPLAIPGLTLGCMLFNLIGAFTGTNPIGYIDAIVGSFATLLASTLTYLIGKRFCTLDAGNKRARRLRYLLIPLPSVLINAIIIGAELSYVFGGDASFFGLFLTNMLFVLIGQVVVCYGLGVPFMVLLERNNLSERLFS